MRMHSSLKSITVWMVILSAGPALAQEKSTHMVAMSDGVKLATDVYMPRGKGPFPVILTRTPYNKSHQRWGAAVATGGYVVVAQDMRGRFASGGENVPFVGCGWGKYRDGSETVAWIMKQSWCNGKIGTIGGSAGGITQNLLACTAPKGLKAQYIQVAAGSLFHHATYVGGAMRASQVLRWLKSNRFDPKAAKLMREHTLYDDTWQGPRGIGRLLVDFDHLQHRPPHPCLDHVVQLPPLRPQSRHGSALDRGREVRYAN